MSNSTLLKVLTEPNLQWKGFELSISILLIIIFTAIVLICFSVKKKKLDVKKIVSIIFLGAAFLGGFVALFYSITGQFLFYEKGNTRLLMLLSSAIVFIYIKEELVKMYRRKK